MNKSYLIVPLVLLIVFGFLYRSAQQDMKTREIAKQEIALRLKAEEKKRKDDIEAKATADAKRHQEEREAEQQAKEAKRQKEYDDIMQQLKDETVKYAGEADKLSKEAADLELQISAARTEKEKLNRETFELAKAVEQSKINRRNAEIEIQRLIQKVAEKLNDNSILVPPPPPPLVVK